jgi:hypothetical protein
MPSRSAASGVGQLSEDAEPPIAPIGSPIAIGVTAGDGFVLGLAAGFMATPLFQINFLPDLMQVYFLPLTTEVAFTLVHFAPAFAVKALASGITTTQRAVINKSESERLIMLK